MSVGIKLARCVWFCVFAGTLGGLFVFVVESVDRVSVLWPSFASATEAIRYTGFLTTDVLVGLGLGALAGIVLGLVRLLSYACEWTLQRVTSRGQVVGAMTLAAIIVTVVVRLVSIAAHVYVDDPLFALARRVSDRIVKLPFLVAHFGLCLTVATFVAAVVLVVTALAVELRAAGRWRWATGILAASASVAVVAAYGFDSRVFFGRYELSMHLPAEAVVMLIATIAAALSVRALAIRVDGARACFSALLVVALAASATALSAATLDTNQNLKALMWRRAVVGRRAFQTIAWLTDHDADGFTDAMGGGDANDSDPGVNPLATEIPANSVDENCIGGDMVAATAQMDPPPPAGPGVARNFILISIDTLRADRMSCFGYYRPTAKRLEELGELGRVFDRAYSQGTNTGISFASMQKSATRHAIFDESRPTLFGRLSDAGFKTTFINARRDDAWLETRRWSEYRGVILDGIQTYDHVAGDQLWDGDRVTDRAIEYLSSLPPGARHATWVHYLDPHEPRKKMAPFDFGNTSSDAYDTEVAFSDREVGRLIDWLRSSGMMQNSLVVLVADHGESFLDHGMDLHGNRPYDEQVHVPLMMWAPDVEPGRVHTPVGVWDVAPSVLAYLGLQPLPFAEGRDILRSPVVARPIFSETPRNLVEVSFFAYAVTDGDWRYIYDVRGNTVELYDLSQDPLELRNMADAMPEKAAEMRAILARWLDTTESVRPRKGA